MKVSIALMAGAWGLISHSANGRIRPDTTLLKADAEVVMFAPGIIPGTANSVAAPAFAPDGKSVYFGQTLEKSGINIVVSHFENGVWTAPCPALFAGDYPNLEPAFDPNGKFIVFASSRGSTPGEPLLDGYWNHKRYAGKGGNLWKVNYSKKGWSHPERLPDIINKNSSVFSPAVTGDGSLYFMRADTGPTLNVHGRQIV